MWRRKSTTPKSYPKDINELPENFIGIHFPSRISGREVIVVEDIPSANKMDEYFPTVALLGTNLNEEKMTYLLKLGINHVIIALDNDATRKAIKLARKFMVNTTILPLQRDLKDQSPDELKTIVRNLYES